MLKISLDFLKSLPNLPFERLRKIPKFVQMLHGNPNLPSLRLEHLASVDLYSARIDDSYRAILCRRGADYILLRADKHEEAYHWAEQVTGSSQSIQFPVEADISIASVSPDQEGLAPPGKPGLSTTAVTASPRFDALRVGSIHTWHELEERFAWDPDTKSVYLGEKSGRIVCACLRADKNPCAPWKILVGKMPQHIRKAELFAQEPSPIPVFIRQAENQWEYWGQYRFERCEKDLEKFRPELPANRLEDTSMVLYLSEVE